MNAFPSPFPNAFPITPYSTNWMNVALPLNKGKGKGVKVLASCILLCFVGAVVGVAVYFGFFAKADPKTTPPPAGGSSGSGTASGGTTSGDTSTDSGGTTSGGTTSGGTSTNSGGGTGTASNSTTTGNAGAPVTGGNVTVPTPGPPPGGITEYKP